MRLVSMENLRERAIELADRYGFLVFPLKPRSKEPLITGSFKKAVGTTQLINQFWSYEPNANIGIATGKMSRIVVIDIDSYEAYHALKVNGYELPETFTVKTPRGKHYYYRYPEGKKIGNRAGILPKIDVRGDGGYVVAPGSINADGVTYEICDEEEIAELPPWFIILYFIGKREGPTATELSQDDGVIFPEGERNDRLYRFACLWRRKAAVEDQILSLLLLENKKKCRPPLLLDELKEIAASSMTHAPAEIELPDTPHALAKALTNLGINNETAGDVVGQAEAAKGETPATGFEISLIRRTHGKGRGGVFNVEVDFKGKLATLVNVDSSDILFYQRFVALCFAEGLSLPESKEVRKDWSARCALALRNSKVEKRDEDESAAGAVVETAKAWIEAQDTAEDMERFLEGITYRFYRENGTCYFSSDRLRKHIKREIRDARREDITQAFKMMGIRKTIKKAKDGKFRRVAEYVTEEE